MKLKRLCSLCILAGMGAALPAVAAVTVDELALRQNEMRQDLRALDERLRRLEAQMSSQALLNLLNQVAELKAELARLRGQQEELQDRLAVVQRRQKDLYEELDGRVRELANRPAPSLPVDAIQLQPSRALLLTGSDPAAETRAYEAALAQFRAGDYAAAVRAFQAFLRDHPASGMASNAYYWLGLAHAAQGNYSAAVESYQRLLEGYPTSNKVPDAMVSLARARLQLGEAAAAQGLLDQVVSKYPHTRAAETARRLLATLK
ncbi:MAG: tol-pal system protein YbgF [Thiobacillaceae bacterium]|nr:tol-pal system protein YbgF [Thiobacillaceae bacterium]